MRICVTGRRELSVQQDAREKAYGVAHGAGGYIASVVDFDDRIARCIDVREFLHSSLGLVYPSSVACADSKVNTSMFPAPLGSTPRTEREIVPAAIKIPTLEKVLSRVVSDKLEGPS